MPIPREATYQCTADPFEPATVVGTRQGGRRSTSRYPSTHNSNYPSRPSEAPALTQKRPQTQARLLEAARKRPYDKWDEREQSQRTLVPSQRRSQQSTYRPSQQSTSKLYAPLTSVLPPKPTAEDLLSGGFTYAYSSKGQDVYEQYTEATSGSKVIRVKDTVAIPSLKR